ncbi:MAG: tetratricopeptide repeat protein, partial [Gemmatimonadota bacterium]
MSRPLLLVVLAAGLLVAPADLSAQRIKLSMKLSELEKAAVADSNDAVAHYNLALGLWGKKRLDDAEQSLKTALELDPRFAPAHLALAYIPFARNDDLWEEVPEEWKDEMRESDRNYRRAFMIDPLVELRIVGAVVPAKSVLWTHDEVLSRLYDEWIQGFDDFRDGKYSAAYFRFDRMIDNLDGDKHPDRVPTSIFWFQCLTAAHLERYDEAIEIAQYLLDQSKQEEEGDHLVHLPLQTNEYRYVLAFLHQKAGLRDAAAKLYQETLENDFGLYMAHVRLA